MAKSKNKKQLAKKLELEIRKDTLASQQRAFLMQKSRLGDIVTVSQIEPEDLQALIDACRALVAATTAECEYLESLQT